MRRNFTPDEDAYIVAHYSSETIRRMAPREYLTNLAQRVARRDPWLRIEEAAREMGVVPDTVRRWIQRGYLPARHRPKRGQFGRSFVLVIRRSDIPAALERMRAVEHANRSRASRERFARG